MIKYILRLSLILGVFSLALVSCDTDVENEDMNKAPEKLPEYYENLRAYKSTMHNRPIAFGWFANWTAAGPSYSTYMASIPDSMDVISIWSDWRNQSEGMKQDLAYVKQTKGTKFVACMIVDNLGKQFTPDSIWAKGQPEIKKYWGWEDGNAEKIETAIRKYAKAIVDEVLAKNLDGFDIDYEVFDGTITQSPEYTNIFIDELGKYFGPKSGTDNVLLIDGYVNKVPLETADRFDWYVIQAYYCSGDATLDGSGNRFGDSAPRLAQIMSIEEVTTKIIMTEDFEYGGYAPAGGRSYTRRDGTKTTSLLGMAMYEPYIGGKPVNAPYFGGCGTYHMENEYRNTPQYRWIREAIQIMNPAKPTKE